MPEFAESDTAICVVQSDRQTPRDIAFVFANQCKSHVYDD